MMKKQKNRVSGEHQIYCCGARVGISGRGVKVLTEPTVEYCPLHEAMYGTKHIDSEAVRKTVETKITRFGFCCKNRRFDTEPIVAYGASEMISIWLDKKLIDCAIVVCEGAGTVIAVNGKLVQAIGARLTGIIKTSPIREIIEQVETCGGTVLDRTCALIDQVAGVKLASDLGFSHIAVSVAGFQAKVITEIRSFERNKKIDALIFSICNTCVADKDVQYLADADLVCASASKVVRREIGSKALLQIGITIPVYALTEKGKRFALTYLTEFPDKLVIFRTKKLPYEARNMGPRLHASQVRSQGQGCSISQPCAGESSIDR